MSRVVPKILKLDSVESTNALLKEKALSGAESGTVLFAKQQTSGRGRSDRRWHSPPGGLYFSILLRFENPVRFTDFPLLAGAVMSQTVKYFMGKPHSVGVKWPNDCLLDGKKVGGVLCEVVGELKDSAVIIGVGMNINIPNRELKEFINRPFKATSFHEADPNLGVEPERVLLKFLELFFNHFEFYRSKGFSFVQSLWEKECLFIGKKIELKETGLLHETSSSGSAIRGIFMGIDERGALVLSQEQGERRSYVTGEITCFWP